MTSAFDNIHEVNSDVIKLLEEEKKLIDELASTDIRKDHGKQYIEILDKLEKNKRKRTDKQILWCRLQLRWIRLFVNADDVVSYTEEWLDYAEREYYNAISQIDLLPKDDMENDDIQIKLHETTGRMRREIRNIGIAIHLSIQSFQDGARIYGTTT